MTSTKRPKAKALSFPTESQDATRRRFWEGAKATAEIPSWGGLASFTSLSLILAFHWKKKKKKSKQEGKEKSCCVVLLLCEALSFLGKVTVVMSSASERLRQLLQQHEQQQQQSLQHSRSSNNSNNSNNSHSNGNNSNNSHSNGNNIQQKYNGDDDGTLSVCSKSTDALLNVSFEDAVAQPAEVAMPTIDPLLFSAFPAAEGISNSGTTIAPKEDKQQPHHNSHSLHPTTATTTATTT